MPPQIVLFGPECSGKSTLAEALAEHYQGVLVKEYLRDYAQNIWDTQKRKVSQEDIAPLLSGQFQAQQQGLTSALEKTNHQRITPVFMDTNLEQLAVYFTYYFGPSWGEIPQHMRAEQDKIVYLLTKPDIPWQADDLRDRPLERQGLFSIFKNYLDQKSLDYVVVDGAFEQRMTRACQFINKTWTQLYV